MSENTKSRTSYTPEEKTAIVLSVMNRKTTIQKVCKEKQIAATLISLWKKQAEEAILERFASSRPGRRKLEPSADDIKGGIRAARVDARTARPVLLVWKTRLKQHASASLCLRPLLLSSPA